MKISKESVFEIALGVFIALLFIELGGYALSRIMDKKGYDEDDEYYEDDEDDEYDEDYYDEYYDDPNEMVDAA